MRRPWWQKPCKSPRKNADLTALDISKNRSIRLQQNLDRTGLTARVVIADALDWQPDDKFDVILLDAPCSATGTMRRHPDLPFVKPLGGRARIGRPATRFDSPCGRLAGAGRSVRFRHMLAVSRGGRIAGRLDKANLAQFAAHPVAGRGLRLS